MENNLIIAKFMGWEKCKRCSRDCGYYVLPKSPLTFHPSQMEYHKSWNWLMPVIELISRLPLNEFEKCYPRTFGMQDEHGNYMFRFNNHGLFYNKELITAAYEAVIDFIKQYNNDKN